MRSQDEICLSVLLIGRSDVARLGCRFALQTDPRFKILGELQDMNAPRLDTLHPDLVIFDPVVDGDVDGQLLQRVIKVFPEAAILLLTDCTDSSFMREAFMLGVRGAVLKSRSPSWLLAAAALVVGSRTGLVADRILLEKVVADRTGPGSQARFNSLTLTSREIEILTMLSQGLTDEQVANKLGLAKTTIHSHTSNLLHKLPVYNRVQLGMFALWAGFVKPCWEHESALANEATSA